MKNYDVISTKAVYEKWWRNFYQSYEIPLISTGCMKTKWHFFHRFAGTLPFITLSTTSSVWMILMPWRNELQNICYLLYLDQFCLIYPNSLKPPTIWKLCRYDGILFSSLLLHLFLFTHFKKVFHTSKSSRVKTR